MPNDQLTQNAFATPAAPEVAASPVPLAVAAISDCGRSRTSNQDYAYAGSVPRAPEWMLLAVADGLGGHARGDWASQRTIELLAGSIGNALVESGTHPGDVLAAVISGINRMIHIEAAEMGAAGAATTLVVALIRGNEAWWANVGDSRLYRWSRWTLSQVSADHSWVADQVRSGKLPPSAMQGHPEKNVVTRTVGFEAAVSPDVGGPLMLCEGEILLLCSDGLHGPVSEFEMSRCLGELSPNLAAERLVELANEAGGPDNITVVLGHVGVSKAPAATTHLTEPAPQGAIRKRRRFRRWKFSGLAAVVTLALVAVPVTVVNFL